MERVDKVHNIRCYFEIHSQVLKCLPKFLLTPPGLLLISGFGLLISGSLALVNFYLVPKAIVEVKYQCPLSIAIASMPIILLLLFIIGQIVYISLYSLLIYLRDAEKEEREKMRILTPLFKIVLIFLIVSVVICATIIGAFMLLTTI